MEDKNEDRELKQWNLKTNMMGEEGKLDLDIAKELLDISEKTKEFSHKLQGYNKDNFTKELVHPEFLGSVKRMLNRHFSSLR